MKDKEEINALKEDWALRFGLPKPKISEDNDFLRAELTHKLKSIPIQHTLHFKKKIFDWRMSLSLAAACLLIGIILSTLFQKETIPSLDWSQIDSISEQELLSNIDSEILNEFADPLFTDLLLEDNLNEILLEEYLIQTKIPVEYLQ